MRIFIQCLQVGRGRGRIEVEIALLDVLAVVTLVAGQSEQPLLQNRIASVLQRESEAQAASAVADPQQPILSPAVDAAARMVVREVLPGAAVRRIILPDGGPLAIGKEGTPSPPAFLPRSPLRQARAFSISLRCCCHRPCFPLIAEKAGNACEVDSIGSI